MFNTDMIAQARWGDILVFFGSGSPPLIMNILILNTVFLLIFIYRRTKAKHKPRPNTAYIVQGGLIAANMLLMFHGEVTPMFRAVKPPPNMSLGF